MHSLKTVWSLLWSIPMCVAWLLMYAILNVGWGPKKADQFIIMWNKFAADEVKPLEIG